MAKLIVNMGLICILAIGINSDSSTDSPVESSPSSVIDIKNVDFCSVVEVPLAESLNIDYSITVKGLFQRMLQMRKFPSRKCRDIKLELVKDLKFYENQLPGNWSISLKYNGDSNNDLKVYLTYTAETQINVSIAGDLWLTTPWSISPLQETNSDNTFFPSAGIFHNMISKVHEGIEPMQNLHPRIKMAQPFGHYHNHMQINATTLSWSYPSNEMMFILDEYQFDQNSTNAHPDEITLAFRITTLNENMVAVNNQLSQNCDTPNVETRIKMLEADEIERQKENGTLSWTSLSSNYSTNQLLQ